MKALQPGPAPQTVTLEGRYCRLEPLAERHAEALYAAVEGPEIEARYRWLPSQAPADAQEHLQQIVDAANHPGWLYFAVIDRQSGLCGGRQAFMRIRPADRSIEIGGVLWGRGIARTRIATEGIFLSARHVFEDLGYRRFEWKCNALNTPSRQAAARFGFTYEGVFRQDMIVKGESRDTAWFSMLDSEWPALKPVYEAWLDPANFHADGTARTRLGTAR